MKRNTFNLARSLDGVRRNHKLRYGQIVKLRLKLSEGQLTQKERVDAAYILREMADVYDDLRKELRATQELITKMVCAAWIKDSETLSPDSMNRSIRGELALGTPDIKFTANVPSASKDPELYKKFMTAMGVDESLHGMIRPHWPSMREYISTELAAGHPPPPGINPDDLYPDYRLSLRKLPNGNDEKGDD